MISDEAVETVAMIVYRTSGRKRVMSYEQARPTCMDEAREILEAAAPHMMAVAWDEGARAVEKSKWPFGPYPTNSYRSQA